MSTKNKSEKVQKEAPMASNGTPVSQKLHELAKFIQEGHDQVLSHSRSAVAFAHKTGNYLLEAKALVNEAGQCWSQWREHNCKFSKSHSERYIRIADRYHELLAKAADPEQLTLAEVLRLLSPGKGKANQSPLTDSRFEVASQDEYKEKLIEAGSVPFGAGSAEEMFVNDKVGSLTRQMVAVAKRQRKDNISSAAVAIALLQKLKKMLDDSLVVKIAEAAVPPAGLAKVEHAAGHRNGTVAA
jgi:Protein of unknown function (DUF3102)